MDFSNLVSNLTKRERARQLTGKDMFHLQGNLGQGFSPILVTDGPHGIRNSTLNLKDGINSEKATCFPTSSALACTWDKNLMREVGNALGEECLEQQVSVLLGPGVNIKRNPLCGRNFEYFSEDPVVAGELASEYINGLQEKGIGACIKHFAVNNTENRRMKCNSIVDERALREIYLRPFEIAVSKSNPWSLMCAYNKVNGTYCTESSFLISDILRDEWGYQGVTISDWMAVDNRVNALGAGLDIEMPSTGNANVNKIAKAIRKHELDQKSLDDSVNRIFDLYDKADGTFETSHNFVYDRVAHHELAQRAAEESIVLLKNDDYVLPIKRDDCVTVIGELAKEPMYQGHGSSKVNPYKVDNAFDSLKYAYSNIKYAKGYTKFAQNPQPELIEEAKQEAKYADLVLVFVGADESDICEGFDRIDMKLSNAQNTLIEELCKFKDNVVVVLTSGSCVEMPWINEVKGVVQCYPLGQGGGVALADVLIGNKSPSGKLAETFPYSFEDTPAMYYYGVDEFDNVQHREGIFVGYRYYEKVDKQVMFPFGHGLSYTTFSYKNVQQNLTSMNSNQTLEIEVDVTNTGYYEASEVVQLYLRLKETILARPYKELKAFERVSLKPNETKTVKFTLDRTDFAYFSSGTSQWIVESGTYDIYLGSSSADIRKMTNVIMNSLEEIREVDDSQYTPNYYNGYVGYMDNEEFENVIGRDLSDFYIAKADHITKESTLSEIGNTRLGSKVLNVIDNAIHTLYHGDEISEKIAYCTFVETIPIKRFSAITKGYISESMIDSFVHLLNTEDKKGAAKLMVNGVLEIVKNAIPLAMESPRQK